MTKRIWFMLGLQMAWVDTVVAAKTWQTTKEVTPLFLLCLGLACLGLAVSSECAGNETDDAA